MKATIVKIICAIFNCDEATAIHKLNSVDESNRECFLKYSPSFTFAHNNWDEFLAELNQQLKDVPAPKDGSMVLVETRATYVHRFLEPANPVYA